MYNILHVFLKQEMRSHRKAIAHIFGQLVICKRTYYYFIIRVHDVVYVGADIAITLSFVTMCVCVWVCMLAR